MKKFVSLLLALVMLLSLAACASTGNDSDGDGDGNPTTSSTPDPNSGNGGSGNGGNGNGGNGNGGSGGAGDGDTQTKEHTIEMLMQEALEMELCGKTEHVKGSLPQEVWDWYESEHGLTYEAAIVAYEKHQEVVQENNEWNYGANYHFTFTIDETRELLDGVTTEQIATALAEYHSGVDASKVTDTRHLVITTTQSGDEDSFTGTVAFNVVQYDGRWYSLTYSTNAEGRLFANFSSTAIR